MKATYAELQSRFVVQTTEVQKTEINFSRTEIFAIEEKVNKIEIKLQNESSSVDQQIASVSLM